MKKAIRDTVESLKRENPDVKRAFDAMRAAGKPRSFADVEIGRAVLGCLWETSRSMPNRLNDVMKALAEGKSTQELFPDSMYEEGGDPGSSN